MFRAKKEYIKLLKKYTGGQKSILLEALEYDVTHSRAAEDKQSRALIKQSLRNVKHVRASRSENAHIVLSGAELIQSLKCMDRYKDVIKASEKTRPVREAKIAAIYGAEFSYLKVLVKSAPQRFYPNIRNMARRTCLPDRYIKYLFKKND